MLKGSILQSTLQEVQESFLCNVDTGVCELKFQRTSPLMPQDHEHEKIFQSFGKEGNMPLLPIWFSLATSMSKLTQ